MAVRANQRQTGLAETLHMDGMADAVAGPAVPDAEASACAAQEQVLVGVQMVVLDEVVVDILRRKSNLDPVDAHRLEFEHHQRAENILTEGLIDRESDLLSGARFPFDQMGADEFLR